MNKTKKQLRSCVACLQTSFYRPLRGEYHVKEPQFTGDPMLLSQGLYLLISLNLWRCNKTRKKHIKKLQTKKKYLLQIPGVQKPSHILFYRSLSKITFKHKEICCNIISKWKNPLLLILLPTLNWKNIYLKIGIK